MKIFLSILFLISLIFLVPKESQAIGCLEYGMAYQDLNGYCRCYSGYVMRNNAGGLFGGLYCVSYDTACKEDYGSGATSDSSGSCKCRFGYVWGQDSLGRTKCIDGNQSCINQYGYNSSYDSLSNTCECRSGYVFANKKYGAGLECQSCTSLYGSYSSYNRTTKNCECDSGYTLNEQKQCVKKQNNVYFYLKELDTNKNQAIIQSVFDNQDYLIEYRFGCFSFTFEGYVNKLIVVNLGTDFSLDMNDKIVLQDDNEVCEISSTTTVDSSFVLNKKTSNILSIPISRVNVNYDPTLTERLKGRILLQIESRGEAWYVNPQEGKRYYMANGNEAYTIMRNQGVGITNKDLQAIQDNKTLAKKHTGKIFLQVESKGEAYYVYIDGTLHYLKNGEEAYNIMRNLGLGITNADLAKIEV